MKVFLLGCGAVARTLLLIFLRKRPAFLPRGSTLFVVDKEDRHALLCSLGLERVFAKVDFLRLEVREGGVPALAEVVGACRPDLFIDATYGIHTLELLRMLDRWGVPYINSSVEDWDILPGAKGEDPNADSLSRRQAEIEAARPGLARRATSLLDMGVNPGLISAMTKRAVRGFHRRVFGEDAPDVAAAAARLDVRAAVVTEVDCQATGRPRRRGEFVNTWSPDGYIEEAFSPAEYTDRGVGVVVDPARSYYTQVFSRTPLASYYTGYAVRHSEAITIGRLLQGGAPKPPATVFYAYQSCDDSLASLAEIQSTPGYRYASKRHPTSEIVGGTDEVGILLLTPGYGAHWCGTVQSIHDARRLFPEHGHLINASTVQTAAGYYAGVAWVVSNPGRGVVYPEALDDDFVFGLVGDLIAPLYDGPLEFDISRKPSRRLDGRESPSEPFSFASFVV